MPERDERTKIFFAEQKKTGALGYHAENKEVANELFDSFAVREKFP